MRRRTHKSVIEDIRKLVRLTGGDATVLAQSARLYGTAGTPDLYLRWPKKMLTAWMEVKVEGDKLSPAQAAWIEAEEDAGGQVLVGDTDVLIGWMACHMVCWEVGDD